MTYIHPAETLLETLHILTWLIPYLADWITIYQFYSGYLHNPTRIAMRHIITAISEFDRKVALIELTWSVDNRALFSLMGRGLRIYLRLSADFMKASTHKEQTPPGLLE